MGRKPPCYLPLQLAAPVSALANAARCSSLCFFPSGPPAGSACSAAGLRESWRQGTARGSINNFCDTEGSMCDLPSPPPPSLGAAGSILASQRAAHPLHFLICRCRTSGPRRGVLTPAAHRCGPPLSLLLPPSQLLQQGDHRHRLHLCRLAVHAAVLVRQHRLAHHWPVVMSGSLGRAAGGAAQAAAARGGGGAARRRVLVVVSCSAAPVRRAPAA